MTSSAVPKLIIPGNGEANIALERRLQAERYADWILEAPAGTELRWFRIRQVWYISDKEAPLDHLAAVEAARDALKTAADKDYGTTRATRGEAKDEEVNGHIRNALVAIMPETLKAWLVKYDPYLNKNVNGGKRQQRIAWRRVYKLFPEYRTTLKQETY